MLSTWLDRFRKTPPGVRRLRDGDSFLVAVKGDSIIASTFDISLSHAEFVKRSLGSLPEGAWVGTVRKNGRQLMALNSKTYYGNQLPAVQAVQNAVKKEYR